MTANCGGCQGLGSHRKVCPRHPEWTIYVRPAILAEDIGDTIGSNDTFLANRAYGLAAAIKMRHRIALEERVESPPQTHEDAISRPPRVDPTRRPGHRA